MRRPHDQAPILSPDKPSYAQNETFTLTISSLNISDPERVGIASVALYRDGTVISTLSAPNVCTGRCVGGSEFSSASRPNSYRFTVPLSDVKPGTHSFKVVATTKSSTTTNPPVRTAEVTVDRIVEKPLPRITSISNIKPKPNDEGVVFSVLATRRAQVTFDVAFAEETSDPVKLRVFALDASKKKFTAESEIAGKKTSETVTLQELPEGTYTLHAEFVNTYGTTGESFTLPGRITVVKPNEPPFFLSQTLTRIRLTRHNLEPTLHLMREIGKAHFLLLFPSRIRTKERVKKCQPYSSPSKTPAERLW